MLPYLYMFYSFYILHIKHPERFFTQPISFCDVFSYEEKGRKTFFFAIPKYHHVHSPEGAHQKQGHGPSPGILQMHLLKPCSRAMLVYKYVGYCVSSRQQFYFFKSFLFRIQQLKKLRRSFIHFFFHKVGDY